MKTLKNTLALFLGSMLYILLWQLLSSFGNHFGHPIINENMIKVFTENTNYKKIEKLKDFYFDLDETVTGIGITKGGKLTISEGKMNISVKNWIIQGGVYADEPEVLNSLRHFYDPTQPAGSRYLTDKSRGILGYVQSAYNIYDLPKIDAVEWAVANADHEYNWVQGKIALKEAFNVADPAKKKEYMAKAWRCLGETLHMVADNATPAHVRDDAHPAPLGDSQSFGDPDTFEEYMDYIGENDNTMGLFSKWSKLQADATLSANLKKATTIRELSHTLALYTNNNFFSSQTISGNDSQGYTVVSNTKNGKKYNSPKIDKSMFIGSHFEKNGIKLCAQPWWIGIVSNVSDVFIDKPTVESMATKLIPAAMEGGKNTIRLFIPDIKIKIDSFVSDGTFKGTITHTKDPEYTLPIVYNGPVKILDKKLNIIETVEAKANKFEGKIKDLKIDEIEAFITFGGIDMYSPFVKKSDWVLIGLSIRVFGSFDSKIYREFYGKTTTGVEDYGKIVFELTDFTGSSFSESNGIVSGSLNGTTVQISYDPLTNELTSFNARKTVSDPAGFYHESLPYLALDQKVKGGGIPAKFFWPYSYDFKPIRTYKNWEVKGKEAQKYIQDATMYSKKWDNLFEDKFEEEWLSGLKAADNLGLYIMIAYEKK